MNQLFVVSFTLVLVLWGSISLAWLIKLRVFSPRPLLEVPPRPSNLSLLIVAGTILLYFAVMVFAFTVWLNRASLDFLFGATTPSSALLNSVRQLVAHNLGVITASALAILYIHRTAPNGLASIGLGGQQLIPGLTRGLQAYILIFPFLIGINALTLLISKQLQRPEVQPHEVLQAMREHPSIALTVFLAVGAAIIAPIGEELLFRGLFQTALLQRRWLLGDIGPQQQGGDTVPFRNQLRWRAILISSVVFTAMHYNAGNFEHLPVLFALSVALGYVYERTNNLWAPIALHTLFNVMNTVMFLLPKG